LHGRADEASSWVNDGTTVYNEFWAMSLSRSPAASCCRRFYAGDVVDLARRPGRPFILDPGHRRDGVACDVQWFSAPA
jgi:hypothetical protein